MGDAVWAVVVAGKVEIFTRYVVAKVGVDDPDQQQQRRKRKRRRDDLFVLGHHSHRPSSLGDSVVVSSHIPTLRSFGIVIPWATTAAVTVSG